MYCTSISTLPTFQCSICTPPNQSMVDYTGHFMAYVILSFCRFFTSYECKNEKWPTGCSVNFRFYQNMSTFLINYESVSTRPRFRLNPQPEPSTLYSYNPNVGICCDKKLSMKIRVYTRWKTYSIVRHVQNRYYYSIVTHKWTSLLNQTLLCSIDGYMCQNIMCQISFQIVW